MGSAKSEEEAARIYDKKAITSNGLKAKTNFHYNKRELEAIIHEFFLEEATNNCMSMI